LWTSAGVSGGPEADEQGPSRSTNTGTTSQSNFPESHRLRAVTGALRPRSSFTATPNARSQPGFQQSVDLTRLHVLGHQTKRRLDWKARAAKFDEVIPQLMSGEINITGAAKHIGMSSLSRCISISDGYIDESDPLIFNLKEESKVLLRTWLKSTYDELIRRGRIWGGVRMVNSAASSGHPTSSSRRRPRVQEGDRIILNKNLSGASEASDPGSKRARQARSRTPPSLDFFDGLTPIFQGSASKITVETTAGSPPCTSGTPLQVLNRTEFNLLREAKQQTEHLKSLNDLKVYLSDISAEAIDKLVQHCNGLFEWTPLGEHYSREFGKE
jgi:hypothetical protein